MRDAFRNAMYKYSLYLLCIDGAFGGVLVSKYFAHRFSFGKKEKKNQQSDFIVVFVCFTLEPSSPLWRTTVMYFNRHMELQH